MRTFSLGLNLPGAAIPIIRGDFEKVSRIVSQATSQQNYFLVKLMTYTLVAVEAPGTSSWPFLFARERLSVFVIDSGLLQRCAFVLGASLLLELPAGLISADAGISPPNGGTMAMGMIADSRWPSALNSKMTISIPSSGSAIKCRPEEFACYARP